MENKHNFNENEEIADNNKNEPENLLNSCITFTPDKLIKLMDVTRKVEDGEKLQIKDLIFLSENIDDITKIKSDRWISAEKILDADELWNKVKNSEKLSEDEINYRNDLVRAQQRETVEKMIKKIESGEKDITDRLIEIDGKIMDDEELSKEDLLFLYELDMETKKRYSDAIKKYKSGRDISADYAKILDLSPEELTNNRDKISEKIKVYIGNLGSSDYHIFRNRENGITIYGTTHLNGYNISASPIKIPEDTTFKDDAIFERCNFKFQYTFPKELMFEGDVTFRNCRLTTSQKSSLSILKQIGHIKGELKIREDEEPKKEKVYSYVHI